MSTRGWSALGPQACRPETTDGDGDRLVSFYQRHYAGEFLLSAPTVLLPDGTYLTADNRDDFTFPVQGWEWHDSDTDAYLAMLPERLPALEAQVAELTAALQALIGGD